MSISLEGVSLNVLEHLKVKNGYKEKTPQCSDCTYFIADPDRVSLTERNRCGRNPDIYFPVSCTAVCLKWVARLDKPF